MKTLILSTVAAAVIALSAGAALADPQTDHGFDIMLQSQNQPHQPQNSDRQFLSGQSAYDQGVSDNGKDSAEFRAVQTGGH